MRGTAAPGLAFVTEVCDGRGRVGERLGLRLHHRPQPRLLEHHGLHRRDRLGAGGRR